MDRLLKLQDSIAFPMIAAMAGQTVKVLVELLSHPGTLNGRLDNNLVAEFPAESLIGQYANVRLTGSAPHCRWGNWQNKPNQ